MNSKQYIFDIKRKQLLSHKRLHDMPREDAAIELSKMEPKIIVSSQLVRKWARNAGIKSAPNPKQLRRAELTEKILADPDSGGPDGVAKVSSAEIGRRYGCTPCLARDIMRENGIKVFQVPEAQKADISKWHDRRRPFSKGIRFICKHHKAWKRPKGMQERVAPLIAARRFRNSVHREVT